MRAEVAGWLEGSSGEKWRAVGKGTLAKSFNREQSTEVLLKYTARALALERTLQIRTVG